MSKKQNKNKKILRFYNKIPSLFSILKFFPKKNKETIKCNNFIGINKHFIPSEKEWNNSLYSFNKNSLLVPYFDKVTFRLIKSYLNFYDTSMERNARSMRARRRKNRSTINKTLVGLPNFKHTNTNVNVIVYLYNRRNKYYNNNILNAKTIDNVFSIKKFKSYVNNMKIKMSDIINITENKHRNISINKNIKFNYSMKSIQIKFFKNLIKRFLYRQIYSIVKRQLSSIQRLKLSKFYLLPLKECLESIYKKKVNFTFINIKYLYNNASILTEGIVNKIKKKRNKSLSILSKSLIMFKIPPLNKLILYDDMFNKKKFTQNNKFNEYSLNNYNLPKSYITDSIDKFVFYNINTYNLYDNYINNIQKTMSVIKHKHSNGIRIELAGRLTRRNTAQRSIYKFKYKGNIRNSDSSIKGLSTSVLRGFSKSNVQYHQFNSKVRIGSFGIKSWISSN